MDMDQSHTFPNPKEPEEYTIYISASNEFFAMKKILAMKIHRNEKGKFIALMLLTIFQRILAFFEENFKQKSKFLTKLM